jgi:hypothetical protein
MRNSKDMQAAPRRHSSLRALAVAIVGGGAVAALTLLPGVKVDAQGPVDPANPYPIAFRIADASFIPLNNVNAYLEICYLAAAPASGPQRCQPPYEIRKFKADWRDHALATDQPFTITLDDFMRLAAPAKFGGADISIIVEYQPWNLPFRQEKQFRFATALGIDGKLHWMSRPLDE